MSQSLNQKNRQHNDSHSNLNLKPNDVGLLQMGNRSTVHIYTMANAITILRLGIIPLMVYWLIQENYDYAFWGFLSATLSDGLDGLMARTISSRSRIGALLDPLADKLLLISVFSVLTVDRQIPSLLSIAIVLRDILLITGAAYLIKKRLIIKVAPIMISKINTCFEMVLVSFILSRLGGFFSFIFLEKFLYLAIAITLIASSLAYIRMGLMARKRL